MSILKKLLIFIMIPIMLMVPAVGTFKNNAYASSNFSKGTPVKIGVFFDNIPIPGIKSNELDKDAKIADLERIIEEKERLIQVLLSKK